MKSVRECICTVGYALIRLSTALCVIFVDFNSIFLSKFKILIEDYFCGSPNRSQRPACAELWRIFSLHKSSWEFIRGLLYIIQLITFFQVTLLFQYTKKRIDPKGFMVEKAELSVVVHWCLLQLISYGTGLWFRWRCGDVVRMLS